MNDLSQDGPTRHFETAFCVFMAVLAFLWRGESGLSDPGLMGLFALLMAVNLAAGRALRRWPRRRWLAAAISLADCGVVAAIVQLSGGEESQFWVLYLLPIFSSCLLLGGRETVLVSAGALALNAAASFPEAGALSAAPLLSVALESAVLALAAGVTLRLAASERQARALAQAQRAKLARAEGLSRIGLLGAGAAHDLGNALTVTLGFTDVALGCAGLPEEARRDLAAIRRSTLMARALAASLLGLSRADGEPELFDLNELVREALALCRVSLAGAQLRAQARLRAQPLLVLAPRLALQRLLLNLIANAVRAMARGGRLLLSTDAGQGLARLVVEDDGPGLPPEVLERLFAPFARGGAADGHGLGLYLCAQAARESGGTLSGENRPEGGARFTLTLPLSARAAVERGAAGAPAAV